MLTSLAPELIDSILSHLSGTPAVAECALVCRSWVPSARYHLLPSPQVLRLNPIRIPDFLRLFDSPVSTLSFLFFSELRLSSDQGWKPSQEKPERTCTAAGDFLARNLPLPPIKSLLLSYIDWKRLPQSALSSLHTSYRFVKELEFRYIVSITFPEFCGFITALTALEKLMVDGGVPFDSNTPTWPEFVTTSPVKITHPNLRELVFLNHTPPSMKQGFARAISYPSGIESLSFSEVVSGPQYQACIELLEIAGMSLRSFNFEILCYTVGPHSDISMGSFAELVMLPRNTNLEVIKVDNFLDETKVEQLLHGLRLNPKPALRRLKFGLKDGPDGWETWDWTLVDEALSMISLPLKSAYPELILDLPRFSTSWKYKSRDEVRMLEKAHLQEISEKLKNILLPRTAQRWQMKLLLYVWPFVGDEMYLLSNIL